MTATDAAVQRLSRLKRRAGSGCVGFHFEGAIGSCSVSKPILTPVAAAVPGSREFRAGDVILFAVGEAADILDGATFDVDDRLLFGRGLIVSWPHREGGCPNCR
jgi:uncharacterized protein (DUF779 family)